MMSSELHYFVLCMGARGHIYKDIYPGKRGGGVATKYILLGMHHVVILSKQK